MNGSSGFGSRYIHPTKGSFVPSGESQVEPDAKKFVDAEPRHPIRSKVFRPQIFSSDIEVALKRRNAEKTERPFGDDFAA
jgi:hypothetical protein